jgi:hypothetical protein
VRAALSHRRVALECARDAEVDDPRAPVAVDEDVAGFEVAVDHPLLVAVVHRVADLREQLELLARSESARAGEVGDR